MNVDSSIVITLAMKHLPRLDSFVENPGYSHTGYVLWRLAGLGKYRLDAGPHRNFAIAFRLFFTGKTTDRKSVV